MEINGASREYLVSTNNAGVAAINSYASHPCLCKNLNVLLYPCAGFTVHRRMNLLKLYAQQTEQELRCHHIPDNHILGTLDIHFE